MPLGKVSQTDDMLKPKLAQQGTLNPKPRETDARWNPDKLGSALYSSALEVEGTVYWS